ncbi:hypothetical protein ACGFI9_37300 [Micromonospora sp. NPDC048930]|uniref:hypothetical protein n=1 Tax=Micromonospora sp. NPDC048930 TaxID=3364261 RepID=UPI00371FC8A1
MTQMLTRSQVAQIIGHTTGHVPSWTAAQGITGVPVSGQTLYRADDIANALQAPQLRLDRFIRNPLNRLT